jgi:hypothetical protein
VVVSASNRNEYQEYFLGVKAFGAASVVFRVAIQKLKDQDI